eukprot:gene8282-14240_t
MAAVLLALGVLAFVILVAAYVCWKRWIGKLKQFKSPPMHVFFGHSLFFPSDPSGVCLAFFRTLISWFQQLLVFAASIFFARLCRWLCQVIYDVLKDDYFSVPSSEQEWINLADATEKRWQFPNAFAAADGKHIAVYHPDNSGGTFYNYKGFYSIVLLAFVDYDYKFIYADVGCQGFADEVVDDNVIDGRWREGNTGSFLEPLPARLKGNKPKVSAEKIREIFAEHFYGPGEVPWQWKCLV